MDPKHCTTTPSLTQLNTCRGRGTVTCPTHHYFMFHLQFLTCSLKDGVKGATQRFWEEPKETAYSAERYRRSWSRQTNKVRTCRWGRTKI